MRCLSPRTLLALRADRLGQRARLRAEAHLRSCEGCQLASRRLANVQATLRDIAAATPPAPGPAGGARLEATLRWTRVTGPLAAVSARRSWFSARPVFLAGGAFAALALAVGGVLAWRVTHRPTLVAESPAPVVQPSAPTRPAPPADAMLSALVTFVGGDVQLARDGAALAPLDPAQPILPGDMLVTGANGRVAVQWGEGSGALLSPSSRFTFSRLAPRAQVLRLQQGQIAVRVGPRQPGESLRVAAPDHTVTVHGTWFVVTARPRGTAVEVLEGVVEVAASSGDGASTRLPAPSQAFFARGSGIAESERALSGHEAAERRAAGEMGLLGWSSFDALLDDTGLLRVDSKPSASLAVDGVSFGATPLLLRRGAGRHFVELSRPGFDTIQRWVNVGDEPGELRTALMPQAKPPKVETRLPAPEEVRQMVAARRSQVRACYERSLKRNPKLAGTVTVELRVGPAGQVLGTRVTDDTLGDEQVADCLRHETAGWLFQSARNANVVYPFVFRTP